MADKTLNTRIKLKYDELDNWTGKVLFKGEVGFAVVARIPKPEETGIAENQITNAEIPHVIMKAGDGVHKWEELPEIYAKASDVYAWAKKAHATGADIGYEFNANGTIKTSVNSKIAAVEAALNELNASVGGNVAGQITEALAGLNLVKTGEAGKFVQYVQQTDGKVTANAVAFDTTIPAENASTAVAPTTAAVKDYVDTSIGDANEALTAEINGVKDRVKTIEDDYLKEADKTALTTAIATAKQEAINAASVDATTKADAAKTNANTYTDGKIADVNELIAEEETRATGIEADLDARLSTAEGDITELKTGLADVKSDVDTFLASADIGGDALDTLREIQDYINTDGAAADVLTKRVAANETNIAALDEELDALAGTVAANKTAAENDATTKANQALTDAKAAAENDATTKANQALTDAKAYTDAEIQDVNDDVAANTAAISAEVTRATDKEAELNTAITNEANTARAAEQANANAITTEATTARAAEKALGERIDTLDEAAVKTVVANTGLTATKAQNTVTIGIDEDVTFILNCGDASTVGTTPEA